MLVWFVTIYLVISIVIGLSAARRVNSTKDFAIAGRHLPLPMVMATVFATWFGSEAIFGISGTFVQEGVNGIAADPFGASLCLVIAGIFFSTKLYKLNLMTLGDFYRIRYNRTVELLTTLAIVVSYLGWVAAQVKALGLVIHMITGGAVSEELGMVLSIIVVLTYTTLGGMFSIAILDFLQMVVIIVGLLYISHIVADMAGGVLPVVTHAQLAGKLDFFPEGADVWVVLTFLGGFLTMMLGSIPQQDVFQRITSAKSAKVALWGSLLGAGVYFLFTFVPMFIAYAATLIDPVVFGQLAKVDAEQILPTLVMQHTPLLAQVLFFGAVISAIMSTASATLLAPSVTFAENILKDFMPEMTDKAFLRLMRLCLFGFALVVLIYALNSDNSIFGMVESAYKVTLAGAFVPLVFGAFWKRATNQGALSAIVFGVATWLAIELIWGESSLVPAQLIGLVVSAFAMVTGSLLPQWVADNETKLNR